jgi:hypothetical protein
MLKDAWSDGVLNGPPILRSTVQQAIAIMPYPFVKRLPPCVSFSPCELSSMSNMNKYHEQTLHLKHLIEYIVLPPW